MLGPVLLLDSGVTPYLVENRIKSEKMQRIPNFAQVGRSPAQEVQRVGEESLPQRKLYFNDNVSENGGPGRSPGELWVLSFSGKYLARRRNIPQNKSTNPNLSLPHHSLKKTDMPRV